MGNRRQLLRDSLIVTGMVGLSFGGGWWAYGYSFANSRRITFDFSQPFIIPRTHESVGLTPRQETTSFLVGDRIDIFVQDGESIEPLILDAVVTGQTKTNFGMLLPYGGRVLLKHAMDSDLRLLFRLSNAPTAPVTLEPYRR